MRVEKTFEMAEENRMEGYFRIWDGDKFVGFLVLEIRNGKGRIHYGKESWNMGAKSVRPETVRELREELETGEISESTFQQKVKEGLDWRCGA